MQADLSGGLAAIQKNLAPGHGNVEVKVAVVDVFGYGTTWHAGASASWNLGHSQSLFGEAYVGPADLGVGVGYRWDW